MAKAEAIFDITPKMMAQAFWNMDAQEQAMFFAELNDVIGNSAYGHGEMQWCYLADELNKNKKAKEQACAMLAWVFNHATEFLNRSL